MIKLDMTPKQADLVIDLLSNKAADLSNTLKNLDNSWGIYGDIEVELLRTVNLHTSLTEIYNREVN